MPARDPFATFPFVGQWGDTHIGFSEVTGLDMESPVIEYRHSSTPGFSPIKLPEMRKFGNITLKRGIVHGSEFYNWVSTTKTDTAARRDLVISLLNEKNEPLLRWKVKNAVAAKIVGPQLGGAGNDVAFESIEVAHDGLEPQAD
jgi:phage tail-like protein